MIDVDPICATCGKPRSNHPYRHPFKGPSRDDSIKELTAKLAEVEAERDALRNDPDRSVYLANHRQAHCIHATAAALGSDYAGTIEGLPKAAKHVAARAEAAEAKLKDVEAERDALLDGATAAYFAGSGDTKARERDAFERGFKAALETAKKRISQCLWGHHWTLDGEPMDPVDLADDISAIPLPDKKGKGDG